jgi:uncharacterized protein (TIGR02117 family)
MLKPILAACLMVLSACSAEKDWRYLPATPLDEVSIVLVNHGKHTGIAIPGKELSSDLVFLKQFFGESLYFEFGWGEAGFYPADEVTTALALKALFWKNRSVIHVAALPVEPGRYFPDEKRIVLKLSREGLARMQQSLSESFEKAPGGAPVVVKRGLYGHSLFFSATGTYYFANTCNTWTAMLLDRAGVPIRTFFSLTAAGIMSQVEDAMLAYHCCP